MYMHMSLSYKSQSLTRSLIYLYSIHIGWFSLHVNFYAKGNERMWVYVRGKVRIGTIPKWSCAFKLYGKILELHTGDILL